ncbi:MAG: LTA synthase family protein, partial [Bdellovibrionota bacterium]
RLLSTRLLPVAFESQPRRLGFYGSLIFILLFSVVGARSSFGHRPANVSTASFSSEFWLNQLGLNSTYTLVYAMMRSKDEKNPMSIYPSADIKTLMGRYRDQGATERKVFVSPKIDEVFYKIPHTNAVGKKIENVVWILEESFGAEYTGSVGHLKLTPNFDKWSRKGALFSQLYATGTRTSRGLEALLTGLPPTPSFSVVKLAKANRDFFTMATLLKEKGFQTVFMYPGDSNFDDMKAFFLGNGFEKVYDQKDLSKGLKQGVWGVHDDDLLIKAHAFLKNQTKPTFLVVLTTSNHTPYDYDASRVQLDARYAKATPENAIHYADYAIGLFFDLASREAYFNKSLFMVVADHNTRVYGEKYFPVYKFHIPAFIIAPGLKPQMYGKLMSQIDLPSTVLGLLNFEETLVPFVGRDVFNTSLPGRAIMQYGDEHLYLEENQRALLLRPHMPAEIFSLANSKWTSLPYSESFFLDGYKYPSVAWHLYNNELMKSKHRPKSSLSQN